MIKKLMLTSTTIGLITLGTAYAMPIPPQPVPQNTISFSTQDSVYVKSDTALVEITVNATAMKDSKNAIEKSATDQLNSAVKGVNWKVTDYQQNQAASGVINITMKLQARLTQVQIYEVTDNLKNPSVLNQKLSLKVLSFTPTEKMLKQAKSTLMVTLYQSLQNQVNDFNQKTHSNYHIQSVNFNDVNAYSPKARTMMLAQDSESNAPQKPLEVSQKVILNAYVTFAEGKASQHKQRPSTQPQLR